jgi:TonB family protein
MNFIEYALQAGKYISFPFPMNEISSICPKGNCDMRSGRVLHCAIVFLLTFELGLCLFADSTSNAQEYQGNSLRASSVVPSVSPQEVESPVALQQPMPAYTEEARVSSVEGTIQIQVMVRKDGTVGDLKVLEGLGYGLDESAIHTIATKWRFRPGTRSGERVDMWTTVGVPFRLDSMTDAEREKRKEYPLRVFIAGTRWTPKPFGRVNGSGYINVLEGESFRGFEYTCSCKALSRPFNGDRAALAKWIEPAARLEILIPKIGDPKKLDECELKVALVNYVYMPKNGGGLISLTMEQWKDVRESARALERAMHPTDVNLLHYPLGVELLEMNWSPFESYGISLRGFSTIGRGNVYSGDKTAGFDFRAVCPGPLQTSMPNAFYRGRWQLEGAQLLVLGAKIGDNQTVQACELKTSVRPEGIYVKSRSTGNITLLTQSEYHRQVRNAGDLPPGPESPVQNTTSPQPASSLTNLDVIAMVNSGLSLEVILAKINAVPCSFDTSPEGLRRLKDAHVPDEVVIEMVKRR